MIVPSKETVLLLHQLVAQESGGDPGVRDEALLDSALASGAMTQERLLDWILARR